MNINVMGVCLHDNSAIKFWVRHNFFYFFFNIDSRHFFFEQAPKFEKESDHIIKATLLIKTLMKF